MIDVNDVGDSQRGDAFLVHAPPGFGQDAVPDGDDDVTQGQAWCLYCSHFLSMWNSRIYEFGAILFIQSAFPGSLTASSINGIAETLCVLLFSSASGRWIDNASSRLRPLLLTIVTNRTTVVACCLLWFLILTFEAPTFKETLFAVVVILGMIEKVSRMANILSMERDWVPTIANPPMEGVSRTQFDLTHLNTIMRRIDMLCKCLAPMAVATFISVLAPIKVAIVVVAMFSMLSWGIECWTVKKVWNQNRRLRTPKDNLEGEMGRISLGTPGEVSVDKSCKGAWVQIRFIGPNLARKVFAHTKESFYSHKEGIRYFFTSSVWIPSLCVAILHASVLSWSATLLTYLLNAGFSLGLITVARAIGSIFEIGSTFIFPWAVYVFSGSGGRPDARGYLKFRYMDDDEHPDAPLASSTERSSNPNGKRGQQTQMSHDMNVAVVRVGLWGICGLMVALIPVLFSLFYLPSTVPDSSQDSSPLSTHPIPTLLLCAFLSMSLVGRWTYDLSTTQLTQTLVPSSHRSSFGGTEMSIVGCVSLTHWVSAAIWHEQSDFRWLALGSFLAVAGAAGTYAGWARWWGRGGGGLPDVDGERDHLL